MHRILFAAAGVLLLLLSQAGDSLAKEKGDWVVRLRGLAFITDTDGTTDTLGGDARTSNDGIPELDFSYFFTDNIAVELILATAKHNVEVKNSTSGDLDLGTVRTLPPVLTLQYHFNPKQAFSPYLGAGVNYTITYDVERGRSVNSVDYSNEFGWALQAGMDYQFNDNWMINFDLKKVFVSTDITVNGGAINANDTDLDPWIVGVGVGYKF
jgi:outer membrane protein